MPIVWAAKTIMIFFPYSELCSFINRYCLLDQIARFLCLFVHETHYDILAGWLAA